MKDENGGVWGYTKKDWENFNPKKPASENPPSHYFRGRKCIHETIDAKKAQIAKDLDQIYLLSVEAAKCDAEIQALSKLKK